MKEDTKGLLPSVLLFVQHLGYLLLLFAAAAEREREKHAIV
jgi:hypothetical protein